MSPDPGDVSESGTSWNPIFVGTTIEAAQLEEGRHHAGGREVYQSRKFVKRKSFGLHIRILIYAKIKDNLNEYGHIRSSGI